MSYIIYKLLNIESNRVYIGLTRQGLETRWKQHIRASKQLHVRLHHAIAKYGLECWEKSIVEECPDLIAAKIAEIKWIKFFNSHENGYNCTIGGDGCGPLSEESIEKIREARRRAPPVSEESRAKMRISALNRPPVTEETRKKLSESNKGKNKGRVHTEETRKNMSLAHIGFKPSKEHVEKRRKSMMGKNSVKVDQLDLEGNYIRTFSSIIEAEKYLNISNIGACCRGKRFSAGGYKWRYKDSEDNS